MYVCRWYHGKITREEADAFLTPRKNGLFLIRASTNFPGNFALSVGKMFTTVVGITLPVN